MTDLMSDVTFDHATIEDKIKNLRDVIEDLMHRIESIEDTIQNHL